MRKTVRRRTSYILFVLAFTFLLSACGSNDHDTLTELHPQPAPPDPEVAALFPYLAQSPFADRLVGCVTATEDTACSLGTLPLLAQQTASPTATDVMNRVVVSHAWMGERFQQVLADLPPDLLTLFKGVTAIVIADGIRPSFYYAVTGAIYLDPSHFWLTDAERRTISPEEDFRSGYGNALQFISLWRYVKGNAYASRYYDPAIPANRPLSSIRYPVAALLFHELAHANDTFPTSQISSLSSADSVYTAASKLQNFRTRDRLQAQYPLVSMVWRDLGAVLFQGVTATSAQRSYSSAFVGAEFESDNANDDYAYAHPAEDVAMLFEELMMKHHFNVDREIAYAPALTSPYPTCADVSVTWGNRNRIGDPEIRERARLVASDLLPGVDFGSAIAALASPTLLTGGNWCLDQPSASPLGFAERETAPARRVMLDMLPPHAR